MTGAANGQPPAPFDLDAASKAAAAESAAVPFVFTYRGESYTAPHALEWPVEAQRLIGVGEIAQALPMLLGDQYEQLCQAGITMGELTLLFRAIAEHAGVGDLPKLAGACAARFDPDVEAAMLAAYGVDVLDPRVTPRRIWLLAQRLPPWARLPGEQWSVESDLLALLVDHVANLTWVTLRAAGAKNVPRPRPVSRPRRGPVPARGAAPPRQSWAQAVAQLSEIDGVITEESA